ncbi:hypothetical protein [Mesorhizobium sp. STM 4661]|uniref:hypothetical protein n=1 Tax=Mesorhizobium sp. STM 4661 TaxID=1297570 RepID=UPI0002BE0B13|nr:hypothetical protein [Mesorhizobium sp. STM 4661]CCV16374.1 conserved hypothetical protein [Mesorhizobium sp. STM 4661]
MTTRTQICYDQYIEQALSVPGGYLFLGRGGYCLHYARGATLSGYDCDEIYFACLHEGLPVIDARKMDFGVLIELAFHGPMVAVGHDPGPEPWHALSYAPLAVVMVAYKHKGAEVRFTPIDEADWAKCRQHLS